MDFVSALDEDLAKSASQKAFQSLPDLSKAISELTALKGVGPATASAVLAAYAPDVAPFMSDEVNLGFDSYLHCLVITILNVLLVGEKAMEAALGSSKEYTLKQYLLFAGKLQEKAKVCVQELLGHLRL